jgi:RloB-like protein
MSPLRRRAPVRQPRTVWLVLCEGRVTEKEYFLSFKRRTSIELDVRDCSGGPLTLVKQAKRLWQEAPGTWDHVWCVFDVDDRSREVKQAEDIARRARWLSLAISNPCIELWSLLHFQEQNAWISQEAVQKLLEKYCPGYLPKKRLPVERLFELEPQAIARARKLTPGKNPSTGIPDLIEALLATGRNRD